LEQIYILRYDTIEEFNVEAKAECDQINLARVTRKSIKKKIKTPVPKLQIN